jgi:hypothetical protein
MCKSKLLGGVFAALMVGLIVAGSAHGQISATGSVKGVPDGGNYLYTITLNNTGSTNIDTFWFGWLPDNYDFLTSVPTPTETPANWTSYVETGGYGSSIQFYDTGSSPILAGHSSSAFQFISPDAPSVVAGDNELFGLPETYSYVYANQPAGPLQDPDGGSSVIFSMPVSTPEPAGFAMVGFGGAVALLASRRRTRVAAIR